MGSRNNKRSLVWGALLILFGALSLVQAFTELSAWLWAGILGGAGLLVLLVWLTERSDLGLLITAYVLLAIAALLVGIELNILQDEVIATFVMGVIALPFVLTWLRDRSRWWALIPAYVMIVIGLMVWLIGYRILADEAVATYVLCAIALPFLISFLADRSRWPMLIPAYTLIVIGVMVGLIGLRVLDDLLIPAYVMLAIALPFFVVYFLNRKNWWALIPAGIMAAIGFSFLLAESMTQYVVPIVLILVGVWVLVRQFGGRDVQPVAAAPAQMRVDKAPEIKSVSIEEAAEPAAGEPAADEPQAEESAADE